MPRHWHQRWSGVDCYLFKHASNSERARSGAAFINEVTPTATVQVSVTFRDMANNKTNKHQWIVLDGGQ